MAITYTWTFDPIETAILENGLTDVIKTVHWQFKGTDTETGTAHVLIGSETLPEPNPEDYIEFTNITEETVKNWVLTQMSMMRESTPAEAELDLQQNIAEQINQIDNPKTVLKAAPWIN